jgi:hypothetical protein
MTEAHVEGATGSDDTGDMTAPPVKPPTTVRDF